MLYRVQFEAGYAYWKISALDDMVAGDPSTESDPRTYDPNYNVAMRKSWTSMFFQTPAAAFFNEESVDTIIVAGCVRTSISDSSQWGFRTIVPEGGGGDQEYGPIMAICGMWGVDIVILQL